MKKEWGKRAAAAVAVVAFAAAVVAVFGCRKREERERVLGIWMKRERERFLSNEISLFIPPIYSLFPTTQM